MAAPADMKYLKEIAMAYGHKNNRTSIKPIIITEGRETRPSGPWIAGSDAETVRPFLDCQSNWGSVPVFLKRDIQNRPMHSVLSLEFSSYLRKYGLSFIKLKMLST